MWVRLSERVGTSWKGHGGPAIDWLWFHGSQSSCAIGADLSFEPFVGSWPDASAQQRRHLRLFPWRPPLASDRQLSALYVFMTRLWIPFNDGRETIVCISAVFSHVMICCWLMKLAVKFPSMLSWLNIGCSSATTWSQAVVHLLLGRAAAVATAGVLPGITKWARSCGWCARVKLLVDQCFLHYCCQVRRSASSIIAGRVSDSSVAAIRFAGLVWIF